MEESLIKRGKYICDTIEQLLGLDNKFLMDKIKNYCKYCLSLNKDYVNSAWPGLYEEIEELESWLNKSNIDMRNMRLKEK